MLVACDWGNYQTTLVTHYTIETYPSDIIYNANLKLTNLPRKYDFTFEYNGLHGIAGTLAQDERTALDRNRRGDSKYHQDALIRLLIGLHQFADNDVNVIVGQPISTHKSDKTRIQGLLEGEHTIKVNGITRTINIHEVRVGVEGACAIIKRQDTQYLVDVGSGTINFAAVKNGRFISNQSDTIAKGIENVNHDVETIARSIENVILDLGWEGTPKVAGGGAFLLKDYYPIFNPTLKGKTYPPHLATAIGLYEVGEMIWERTNVFK